MDLKKLAFLSLVLVPGVLFAQNSNYDFPEPKYIGRMVILDGEKTIPLEQQKASSKAKAGASMYLTGIGKVTGTNNINGISSPVRIKKSEKYQFIIRVADHNVDPFLLLNIFKLEQMIKNKADKSYRFIETASTETFAGSSTMDIRFIKFDADKYGENSFLITVTQPLEAGEYALTLDGSRDLFNMFGIDE